MAIHRHLFDAHDAGQHLTEESFGRSRWGGVSRLLFDGAKLSGECRQVFAVNLAIGGQRQAFLPVEGRGNHVRRQRLTQLILQDADLEWPLARVERHQALAFVSSLGDHHRALTHTGRTQ